jgi:hypothetical protein
MPNGARSGLDFVRVRSILHFDFLLLNSLVHSISPIPSELFCSSHRLLITKSPPAQPSHWGKVDQKTPVILEYLRKFEVGNFSSQPCPQLCKSIFLTFPATDVLRWTFAESVHFLVLGGFLITQHPGFVLVSTFWRNLPSSRSFQAPTNANRISSPVSL